MRARSIRPLGGHRRGGSNRRPPLRGVLTTVSELACRLRARGGHRRGDIRVLTKPRRSASDRWLTLAALSLPFTSQQRFSTANVLCRSQMEAHISLKSVLCCKRLHRSRSYTRITFTRL